MDKAASNAAATVAANGATASATASTSSPAIERKDAKKKDEVDDEDEDEDTILEESPCGRWMKRREKVKQRDVPGIDAAYLAMDTEEGVEVVWNEVQFSERKDFKAQENKIKAVFDNLSNLRHANLVKFFKYWMDTRENEMPRVIFITEYMSSGSMNQFLKRSKSAKGGLSLSEKSWKKWCTQILSALSYLHNCDPPIVHGNLSSNTIFIQHNGLIKIGCVAPEAIHHHVKTFSDNVKTMHYVPPEFESHDPITTAADIYSFGICALEMASFGFQTNGENPAGLVTAEVIRRSIDFLKDPKQRDFIESCLERDPSKRPTADQLFSHSLLFEVHSLKLMAAHIIVNNNAIYEAVSQAHLQQITVDKEKIGAEIVHKDGRAPLQYTYGKVNVLDEVDKFLEDVRNGIYPLTAFATSIHRPQSIAALAAASGAITSVAVSRSESGNLAAERALTPTLTPRSTHVDDPLANSDGASSLEVEKEGSAEGSGSETTDGPPKKEVHSELRRVIEMTAVVKRCEETHPNPAELELDLLLRLDDRMNRQLNCEFLPGKDTPESLAAELHECGFIHCDDREKMSVLIADACRLYQHKPPQVVAAAAGTK